MKTIKKLLFVIFLISFVPGCDTEDEDIYVNNPTEETDTGELKHGRNRYRYGDGNCMADKVAINEMMDKIISSFKDQDAATLIAMLSDDAIILGSAPEQVFDKEQISAGWTYILDQTALILNPLYERQIVFSADCKSATGLQCYNMPEDEDYPNVTFRISYHFIKEYKRWKILCWNGAIIMSDDDLILVNDLLGE